MTSPQEVKAEQREGRKRRRLQLLLWVADEWMEAEDSQGMVLNQITVRHGRDRGGEPLVICKATHEGRKFVGFHSAQSVEDALRGALERIQNNDLKWREDHPYQPK